MPRKSYTPSGTKPKTEKPREQLVQIRVPRDTAVLLGELQELMGLDSLKSTVIYLAEHYVPAAKADYQGQAQ